MSDEIQKLKDMITILRRAIHAGTTHDHEGAFTPPLSQYGLKITAAAWDLVPSDEPRKMEGQ